MNRLHSRTHLGIRFADYVFSEPVPLTQFSSIQQLAGIYVVLVPDPTWGPWHLQPLLFGEFGGPRQEPVNQEQQACCLRAAAGRTLYIAVYTLPLQHTSELSRMKQELIEHYHPIGNQGAAGSAEIAQKLNTLEKKILECDAVLRVALAAIGQAGQLPLEPKKRIAGFQPNSSHRGPTGKA
jgi:hypothetical protein